MKIYPTFDKKYFKKRTIKPKIEKRALVPVLYCLCSDICKGKKTNLSPSSLWRSYIVLISQTDDNFVLAYTLNMLMYNKNFFSSASSTIKVLFELVVHLNIFINYLISKFFFQKINFHVLLKTLRVTPTPWEQF